MNRETNGKSKMIPFGFLESGKEKMLTRKGARKYSRRWVVKKLARRNKLKLYQMGVRGKKRKTLASTDCREHHAKNS